MSRKCKLPQHTQSAIINAFKQGKTLCDIAFVYQTSLSTVRRILGAEGLVKCVDAPPKESAQMLNILSMYKITSPQQLLDLIKSTKSNAA